MIAEINSSRFRQYLVAFTRNIFLATKRVIQPKLLPLHFLAITITIPLVLLGIDWQYFVFFRDLVLLQPILFLAVPIGTFVPLLFPAMIYLYGIIKEYSELKYFGYTLTQTAVVGLFWSALYKAFTGRHGPEFRDYTPGLTDYSTDFSFGFLIGGVFDGWPSGHTTIAIAFGIVYFKYNLNLEKTLRSENDFMAKLLTTRWLGIVYGAYVAFGVSTNIHWLSDAIAGILIGICVAIACLETSEHTFDQNSEEFTTINDEIEKAEFDDTVKYTFTIIFITVLFSIIVPREILAL